MTRYKDIRGFFFATIAFTACFLAILPAAPARAADISECYCTSSASGKSPLKYTEADAGGYCHPGDSSYTSCSIIGTCTTMNDISSCTATASQCASGLVYDGAAKQCVGEGTGQRCSTGTWADYTSGTCVATCPSGERYDSTTATCGCGNGDTCSDNADGTNNTLNNTSATGGGGASTNSGTNQGYTALAPIPGLTDVGPPSNGNYATFFNNLYKFLIGLAVTLAVIMIVWGGLEYATQDSVSKKSDGKRKIYNALFGLVLVLAPALVFTIINPAILNLSINLPALKTPWGNYTSIPSYYTQTTTSSTGSTQYAQNACNGSDCSQQASTCTQNSGIPNYDCLDASGKQVSSDTSPHTCLSGQTYRVTCIQTFVSY